MKLKFLFFVIIFLAGLLLIARSAASLSNGATFICSISRMLLGGLMLCPALALLEKKTAKFSQNGEEKTMRRLSILKKVIEKVLTGLLIPCIHMISGTLYLISIPTYYVVCLAEAVSEGFPSDKHGKDYTLGGIKKALEQRR